MNSKLNNLKQHSDIGLIKIYRLPLDTQIMLFFFGIVFAAIGLGLFGIALSLGTGITTVGRIVLPAMGLLMLIFSFWMIGLAIYSETTLYRDRIVQRGIFAKNELRLHNIRGYKRLIGKAQGIELVPNDRLLKAIQISSTDSKTPQLTNWLKDIPSLDGLGLTDKEEEIVDMVIAQDASLGATAEERKSNVASIRVKTNIFTGAYFVVVFVLSFVPSLTWLFLATFVLMPWIAIGLVGCSGANYTLLERDKKTLLRKVDLSFLAMGSVVFFSSMFQGLEINQTFRFPIDWIPLLLTSLVIGILMLALVRLLQIPTKTEVLMSVGLLLAFSVYAVNSLMIFNSFIDKSAPNNHTLEIRQLYESKGKRTSYHLSVTSSDASYNGDTKFQIPMDLYRELKLNGKVCVLTHAGALGMAWQSIKVCHSK